MVGLDVNMLGKQIEYDKIFVEREEFGKKLRKTVTKSLIKSGASRTTM
jgi:hypothetical protein